MARVALRDTIEADLGALFEFQADPEASAMAAFPSRDLPAFLEHQRKIMANPSVIAKTVVVDGVVVGSIGSWTEENEREVGYWIDRAQWGKGYATAALRAFVAIEPHRPLHARVADHNVASRRVLEKCGFVFERSERADDGVLEDILVLSA
jgi:RimJ/RimL family protein N-acetyltransferase